MERELDNTFIGASITLVVCLISGVLWYMFKHAAINAALPPTIPPETSPNRKKTKRIDSKKAKKIKRKVVAIDSIGIVADEDPDKMHTSDETLDEDDQSPNSNHHHHLNAETSSRSSSTDGTEVEHNLISDQTPPYVTVSNTANGDFSVSTSFNSKPQCSPEVNECPVVPKATEQLHLDSKESLSLSQPSGLSDGIFSSSKSTKRSKRRGAKRSHGLSSTDTTFNSSVPLLLPDVRHMIEPTEEVTNPNSSSTVLDKPFPGQYNEKLINEDAKKLREQLRTAEQKLEAVSKKADELSLQNDHLRHKEEENRLGLHVLQEQYQELLRANKTIEHEKHTKDNRIKHLESEKKNLLIRLDVVNAEANRLKAESDTEIKQLREELKETQTKLTNVASAQSAASNPELVRTQELAQLMSNENRLLKNSLELRKAELTQLRQAHMRQQQELQAFQVDNIKLRENQDKTLEELRTKFQVELAEANSRITSYEAQLQRQSREMELEKQELSRTLAEVRTELSSRMDREKRLSEIISSLEYQFSELSAEKQRLLEKVSNAKAATEMSTSGLLVQVANLTNDLSRTTADLHAAQQRADAAVAELERLKMEPLKTKRVNVVAVSTQTLNGDCQTGDRNDTSAKLMEELRSQLQATKDELICTKADLVAGEKLQETTQIEVEHYKSALLHTEDLLAKLQLMVKETESDWRKLLSDSENERERLKKQLACALSKSKNVTGYLEKTDQKRVTKPKQSSRHQTSRKTPSAITSPTCLEESTESIINGNRPKPHEGHLLVSATEQTVVMRASDEPEEKLSPDLNKMESSNLGSPEGESDEDIDAVLVDDTDLHVPDDIWDTSTVSANMESERTVGPGFQTSDLTSQTLVLDNESS